MALILILLLPGLGFAEGTASTRAPDASTLRLQEKAEQLWQEGHWRRAYNIYVNDLAAIGDKYAQYMAGYMCLNGQGVAQDPIQASAWYRLAAERGAREFVEVRDRLLESLSDEEREASDEAYLVLRQSYSDMVIALGHLDNERTLLNDKATGSHLGSNSTSVTILDPHTGMTITRAEYVRRLESRMQVRLDYITDKLGVDRIEPDMSDREFEDLSDQVDAYLLVIDDR